MGEKMKKSLLVLSFISLCVAALMNRANAQVNVGVVVGSNGLDAFHGAIGDYFKVSTQQVQTCQDSKIPDEEQPVVFFIAQRAGVSPEAVILLRSRGWSWMQIAYHYRLNPRIFYTPGSYVGTPYEHGYNSFRGHGRINLSDGDIVNFVNLKFVSEHYGHDPAEIAQMRAQGHNFRDISAGYETKKEAVEWDAKKDDRRVPVREGWGDDRRDDRRDGENR
jgi:uncharacterized protein (DUF433 family)